MLPYSGLGYRAREARWVGGGVAESRAFVLKGLADCTKVGTCTNCGVWRR